MDDLINSLKNFNVNRDENKFSDGIDDIIDKLNNQQIFDTEYEWERLCENYSKLYYLDNTIKNYYIPECNKFLKALELFMNKVDTVNQVYLVEIDWGTNEYPDCENIQKYLSLSYFEKDIIQKLDYCVQAYKLFVPIVEKIRNERYKKIIDEEFTEEFNIKRRRLN